MEEIAQVYSRSLFEVAREQGKLDEIHEQLDEFVDALERNHDLQVFLFSPYFSTAEKKEGLSKVLDGADPVLPVQVTSAVQLDDATVEQIKNSIAEQTDRQIQLTTEVDPDILGGIVLRVGNSILDASIKNRLDTLRRQVARA